MNGFIYKITNRVNGKVYIGQTRFTLEHRWKQHIYESKRDLTKPLYKAFAKYGIENFYIEALEEVKFSELNEREIFWIAKLDSFDSGYNASRGGQGEIKFYSDSMFAEIRDLYLCGFSTIKIADLYNVSEKTITNLLKSMGVKVRTKPHDRLKLNAYEATELINLYKEGANLTQLGRRYGVDKQTIKKFLLSKGVDVKDRYNLQHDVSVHQSLIDDFLDGARYSDLEKKYHSDIRTIKKILVVNGINLKAYRGLKNTSKGSFCLTDEQCLTLIKMYNDRVAVKDIAKRFKIDISTVYVALRKYHVKCNRYNSDTSVQS